MIGIFLITKKTIEEKIRKIKEVGELSSLTDEDITVLFKKLDGMKFNIFNNSWKVSSDTSINYIAKFKKIS